MSSKVGPISLADGIKPTHVYTQLYAAMITIATVSGMSILQAYILREHLGVSPRMMGSVSGNLAFWTEIAALFFMSPAGILSDRIGRRPVYMGGLVLVAVAFGLYPFATSVEHLLALRIVYAAGMAATISMMAALVNDYPAERSRGMLIAVAGMMNILGTVLMSAGIAQIPRMLGGRGVDAVVAGQVMYLTVAGLALITIGIVRIGIKGGAPVAPRDRLPAKVLLTRGLTAARNPRIALSYAGAFAARADVVIKAVFLSLWAIRDAAAFGMTTPEALARFGIVVSVGYVVSFAVAPLFGWYMDRVNRVTAMITAITVAAAGYLSMALITSPLDFGSLPLIILLTLGSSFMHKATICLVGQETQPQERGAIIAAQGICGAVGILLFMKGGGIIFDSWGPWAPFVAVGIYKVLLLGVAVAVRITAPGGVKVN